MGGFYADEGWEGRLGGRGLRLGHAWLSAEWTAGVVGSGWRGREGLDNVRRLLCAQVKRDGGGQKARRNKPKSREDPGKSFVLRKS